MRGRVAFFSVRALGRTRPKTIVLRSIPESRVLELGCETRGLLQSSVFGRARNTDFGRQENKSGGMEAITQNRAAGKGHCWYFYS